MAMVTEGIEERNAYVMQKDKLRALYERLPTGSQFRRVIGQVLETAQANGNRQVALARERVARAKAAALGRGDRSGETSKD